MSYARKSKYNSLFQGKSLLIFILAAWAFYLSSQQVFLRLDNSNTHVPLFWITVKANDSFVLVSAHAHNQFTYLEHYRILNGKIFLLTGVSFHPRSRQHTKSPKTGNFKTLSSGWRTLQGLNKKTKTIPFVMGSSEKTAQTLIIRGRKYSLTGIATPGTPVVLRVLRVRKFYSYLWKIYKWLK